MVEKLKLMTEAEKADDRLVHMLETHIPKRFESGFVDRVLNRLDKGEEPAPGMVDGMIEVAGTMSMMFRRLAVPAMAVCLLLAVHNITVAKNSAFGPPDDLIDAVFALVPASADAALSL